ncbi:nucleotide exchange factor GrpE [Halobacterium salinarum]|uniref:Protein GrpE n=6 Tax=Halobacterium salinarum TaxID=2242 RepID=GRPE_HALSA|nr:nucleotide exchange factor GrpE [Halobacterium salinarum]B0R3H6.1 RecName: Full=Protein GrpE; AltName: Full=HSP-70 cofactor [Halobacterium salinarum R1]Q9HRY0.1 RecName: Full=Protein GrpE; AltName: Full=HSP-70 cofactor [Halobacterium salinarum NRC-1]AAG19028.1 heat shock protein [Halobacterium salinarum NRC-1]MBB6089863.1 molecular chaperone GrpE [Halobacterium salinarum]MDL0125919.1 nucleotide exchange factor GrpE [Halobacterium salinarum]MDL0129658.1 nucleotide exchange factor GrpE [Halo
MSDHAEHAADAADTDAPEGDDAGGDDGEQAGDDGTSALSERVRALDADNADALADDVAALEARVETLTDELADAEDEVADLTERVQTKQADFKNYKERAKRKQEEIRERATEDLVERLLDVRDNLDRALDQEESESDEDGIREGVELTRDEFDRVLETEGVTEIRPEPGDSVDAARHEVMMRVDSDQPAGTIVDVYRPGYEMSGRVVRAAQVTVSEE